MAIVVNLAYMEERGRATPIKSHRIWVPSRSGVRGAALVGWRVPSSPCRSRSRLVPISGMIVEVEASEIHRSLCNILQVRCGVYYRDFLCFKHNRLTVITLK